MQLRSSRLGSHASRTSGWWERPTGAKRGASDPVPTGDPAAGTRGRNRSSGGTLPTSRPSANTSSSRNGAPLAATTAEAADTSTAEEATEKPRVLLGLDCDSAPTDGGPTKCGASELTSTGTATFPGTQQVSSALKLAPALGVAPSGAGSPMLPPPPSSGAREELLARPPGTLDGEQPRDSAATGTFSRPAGAGGVAAASFQASLGRKGEEGLLAGDAPRAPPKGALGASAGRAFFGVASSHHGSAAGLGASECGRKSEGGRGGGAAGLSALPAHLGGCCCCCCWRPVAAVSSASAAAPAPCCASSACLSGAGQCCSSVRHGAAAEAG
mmetsp:Transcript_84295/g.220169  ORF Transcript_84295/g.220169 Transcript_84295/m.220169 type:complete len:328 (-) Transcript_84295:56-1039(-)